MSVLNLSKGELMKLVYTEEELRRVDPDLPIECWKELDTSIHVMDYNEPHCNGKIVNLVEKYEEVKKRKDLLELESESND